MTPALNFIGFSHFPGITLAIPVSFLRKVEFENELAAAMAFEIATLMNRTLAKKLDSSNNRDLYGKNSVFNLDQTTRNEAINLATSLLYGRISTREGWRQFLNAIRPIMCRRPLPIYFKSK